MAFPLLDQTNEAQITAIYVAFFGRGPDPDGRDFWVDELEMALDAGGDRETILKDIAESFRLSDEATEQFSILEPGATALPTTTTIFLQNVLGNMFDRGLNLEDNETLVESFTDALNNGEPIGGLIVDLIQEAGTSIQEIDADGRVVEVERDDRSFLENKIAAAEAYTDAFRATGESFTLDANTAGADAVVAAANDDPASVAEAAELTETILNNNAGDFDILAQPVEAQATALFMGFFGRAPDPSSLDQWSQALADAQAGATSTEAALTDVANQMAQAPEVTDTFQVLAAPESALAPTTDIFITSLFNNLFGRGPTIEDNETIPEQMLERLRAGEEIGDIVVNLLRDASNDTPVEVDADGRVVEVDSNDNTVLANRVAAGERFAEAFEESNASFSLAEDGDVAFRVLDTADASEDSFIDALNLAEAAAESATPALLGVGGGDEALIG